MPWEYDGCERLFLWAREEVPTLDDPILRRGFGRCAHLFET